MAWSFLQSFHRLCSSRVTESSKGICCTRCTHPNGEPGYLTGGLAAAAARRTRASLFLRTSRSSCAQRGNKACKFSDGWRQIALLAKPSCAERWVNVLHSLFAIDIIATLLRLVSAIYTAAGTTARSDTLSLNLAQPCGPPQPTEILSRKCSAPRDSQSEHPRRLPAAQYRMHPLYGTS